MDTRAQGTGSDGIASGALSGTGPGAARGAARGSDRSDGRGDEREQQFATLYRPVAPALYSWAALNLHAPLRAVIDPEDVLQEVACRAYEGFSAFESERGEFRGWIFGIARNVLYQAMDRLRTRGAPTAEALIDLPDTATSITSRVARDEELAKFVRLIEALPVEDRRLLLYRGLEGLSHGRVGELMNLSPEAVMQRWSRLRARLRADGVLSEFLAA